MPATATVQTAAQPLSLPVLHITAEQITELLKSAIQTVRIAYLNVGHLLAVMRDEKRYAELGHANLEAYAKARLQLKRATLYRYIKVYDWVLIHHPEWLDPAPDCFIPDLNDVLSLIDIDDDLKQTNLKPATRAKLKTLKKKALKGTLTKAEMTAFRRSGNKGPQALKAFLSKLRNLRMRGSQLASMPRGVIAHLDSAIDLLKNTDPADNA